MLNQEAKVVTKNRIFFLLVIVAILIFSSSQSELNFLLLLQRGDNMAEYLSAYFPPDFSDWKYYLSEIIITISMGIWGTLMAAIALFLYLS